MAKYLYLVVYVGDSMTDIINIYESKEDAKEDLSLIIKDFTGTATGEWLIIEKKLIEAKKAIS